MKTSEKCDDIHAFILMQWLELAVSVYVLYLAKAYQRIPKLGKVWQAEPFLRNAISLRLVGKKKQGISEKNYMAIRGSPGRHCWS
jgi:hypothetical protein